MLLAIVIGRLFPELIIRRTYAETLSNFVYPYFLPSFTELKFGNWDKYGFLYLDNVSVKPVPEPSTIGGIAIAGLLGIWLKKKKAIT
ncbi:PEP-CTERM sorting domain-containing protein [Nostoc sp.]|uniref:PEP-CTERM sorting domain-containing protein n=1 Tax=Nostoc sp. TaxID=1180 RepID=UPI002FFC754F